MPSASIFGSNTSPPNFESIARARTELATALVDDSSFDEYKSSWAARVTFSPPPDDIVQYVRAHQDALNPGVLLADGTPAPTPFHMYVDDNMYTDIIERMLRAIAASIDSLFIIQGQPHPDRRLALSLSKLTSAPASYSCIILGFSSTHAKCGYLSHPPNGQKPSPF